MVAMKALSIVGDAFSRWIDSVATTIVGLHGWLAPPRIVKLIEGETGKFAIRADEEAADLRSPTGYIEMGGGTTTQPLPSMAELLSGSRLEVILRPDRFLFAPLELPGRAAEFLDGVVRAQIDRLTPWTAGEAAFGWTKPMQTGPDRFVATIAATARARIAPFVEVIGSFGARSVSFFTALPGVDAQANPIKVFESAAAGADIRQIRQVLKILIVGAAFAAATAVSAAAIIGDSLDNQQVDLRRRIASARVAVGSSRDTQINSIEAAHRILEQFKHETPSSVVVLDTLSRILPGHTYVTELRVEDNKLRLTGVTKDAPSLIGLIEGSGRFRGASFFAPTTQSPSEGGEQFHIEADIQPLVPPRS
jgi:general secretion pathway protein L